MPDLTALLPALPLWYAAFLFSITAHEVAHAWAANQGGDPTARLSGLMTLDPRPHLARSKWGLIYIPLISFFLQGGGWMIGWASTPYNPGWGQRYPRRAFAMSMAGPLVNWTIVLVCGLALRILWVTGLAGDLHPGILPFVFSGNGVMGLLAGFLYLCVILNLVLGVFNLLPLPPLDGFSVFGLILNREAYARLSRLGNEYWIISLVLAWNLFGRVFPSVALYAQELLFNS